MNGAECNEKDNLPIINDDAIKRCEEAVGLLFDNEGNDAPEDIKFEAFYRARN